MYLSRLVLNLRHSFVRRDLANPYELHSTLYQAFAEPRSDRVLWRLEANRPVLEPVVLVQSHGCPDWRLVETRDGYAGYFLRPPETKPYMLPEWVTTGQVLRFRLEANPTVTREGRRHGLAGVEEQLDWLNYQATKSGFTVLGATVSKAEYRRFVKRKSGREIVLLAVRYDGYLRVSDPSLFYGAIQKGLGHAKALGLGMLSIAPVK
ncbi:MAG: type I-E CRISPR-associated protein Cas6/Cse3/CasE [Bacillota bacterium]